MLVLYATEVSVYSAKVAIGFAYKGVVHERRPPPGGTYRSADYRARVPAATVPAIDDDGFVLSESDAILEYVEETRPGLRLLPGDARMRARARTVSRWHDLRLEPRVRALFPLVRPPGETPPADAATALAALREAVANLETLAAPAPYAAGEAFSLGDCGWAPTLFLAERLTASLGAAPLALGPKLAAWREALEAVPAVGAVMSPYRDAFETWLRAKAGR